ncbi:hypothetical protein KR009_005803 [Drosophila setifemur]|nr:hypothetical protein KR009_005803 [Drosophila setifemur]
MSAKAIEVPLQPHAGKPMIIKNLIQPEIGEPNVSANKTKYRASYFERGGILKKLIKHSNPEDEITMEANGPLLDGFLAALETYMKYVVKKVLEQCEHRTGYFLHNDERCVMTNDMRTTMSFLNDLEMADYGSSDEDASYYRKRRSGNDQKVVKVSNVHLESVNNTALKAIGGRKRPADGPLDPSVLVNPLVNPLRQIGQRFKYVNVRDVLQFMEEEKRFSRSNLLFEAYLRYKP